jgi:hypothetical protein
MAHLLIQMELQRAGHIKFDIESEEDRKLLASGIHIFDFLNKSGRGDLERRAVINQMCNALYSDMLHFIYEGLRALEKRKYSVAFSLLRKPFKEGMLLAAMMCADEVAFFDKLKFDAKNLLNKRDLNELGTKGIFEAALTKCRGSSLLKADPIYDTAFNRGNPHGLAGLFDKATHLVTEYSKIQTENYNINFIFKNPLDNDIFEGNTYPQIAMLLVFLKLMQIELYSRMREPSKQYKNLMIFTAVGAYEVLFRSGPSKITGFVNKAFKDFLKCPTCAAGLKIKKIDAARLFIGETVDCGKCLTSHHFPFGWLFSKLDVDLFTLSK